MKFILVIIYMILTVLGLTLIKVGGNPGTLAIKAGDIELTMNWVSAIGFICYICSFLLFTRIVVMFDLSYILPITTGIVQIITLIVSNIVFKEIITTKGIIGASLVIIGVIIMNLPKTQSVISS